MLKQILKTIAERQVNSAFTWFNSYEPKMPKALKEQIEE